MDKIIMLILTIWNLIVYIIYGIDKVKAKRGTRRISEKFLLIIAAAMGALGAIIGMWMFRHKTKHSKFKIGIPLLLIVNIVVLCLIGFNLRDKGYVKISAQEAKAMIENKSVVILDVRTEEEFAQIHIEGAVLIPDYELVNRVEIEIPDKEANILVYCRSGRRSELAANELIRLGYKRVYDLGGIIDWPYF